MVNLNPPGIQSSELEMQGKISLKKREKEKNAEISEKDAKISCSWGIFFYKLMSSSKLEMNNTVKEARK